MIYQIAGLVLVVTCAICATWYFTTIRREKLNTQREMVKIRAASTERMVNNGAWKLYEDERQKRKEAETRIGILEHQLKRAREQMATVNLNK